MPGDEREDEALLELAVHMEAKNSGREQLEFLAERVTWRCAWPTLWRIAARGSFWLADEQRVAKNAKGMSRGITLAREDSYDDGLALADLRGDGDDESGALVVYIGECCRQERVFWGLDAGGTPVVLIAAFEYTVGDDE